MYIVIGYANICIKASTMQNIVVYIFKICEVRLRLMISGRGVG